MAKKTPWAVLLCKFRDNQTDPPLSMDLIQKFFTTAGTGTFNAVSFFQEMSHENLDLTGSRIFGWFVLPANVGDLMSGMDPDPPGWDSPRRRNNMMTIAKQAARQSGIPLDNYFAVALVFNIAVGGSQGGGWAGGPPDPGVFSDWRYVRFNGTQSYGQEMGHAYGLNHSRLDGSDQDYRDPWDVMSTFNAYSGDDINYVKRGPGLNACNMRAVGWLDERRVWRGPSISSSYDEEIQLRSLHRHDLPGFLAAEVPPYDGATGQYLVEFRAKDRWDNGIPRSAVLIHRLEQRYSYLMNGKMNEPDLVSGGTFEKPPYVNVKVIGIDHGNQTATVRITYRPLLNGPAVGRNADGRLEVFARDGNGVIWHRWQTAPNNGWSEWSSLGGVDVVGPAWGDPLVACNADGRLVVFVGAGDGAIWYKSQTRPNNGWSAQWASLGGNNFRGAQVCANNADGRLELLARDNNGIIWHKWQTSPNGGWNQNWTSMRNTHSVNGKVSLVSNADGRLEAFVASNGVVWQRWQTARNNGWSEWNSMGDVGPIVDGPVVGRDAAGRLDVFVVSGGAVYHKRQTAPNNGWEQQWTSLGGSNFRSSLSVCKNADGRLEVFVVRGASGPHVVDYDIYHKWQTSRNGEWAPNWVSTGGSRLVDVAGNVAIENNLDGRLELFILGRSHNLYHKWQTAPNNGWSGWTRG